MPSGGPLPDAAELVELVNQRDALVAERAKIRRELDDREDPRPT